MCAKFVSKGIRGVMYSQKSNICKDFWTSERNRRGFITGEIRRMWEILDFLFCITIIHLIS